MRWVGATTCDLKCLRATLVSAVLRNKSLIVTLGDVERELAERGLRTDAGSLNTLLEECTLVDSPGGALLTLPGLGEELRGAAEVLSEFVDPGDLARALAELVRRYGGFDVLEWELDVLGDEFEVKKERRWFRNVYSGFTATGTVVTVVGRRTGVKSEFVAGERVSGWLPELRAEWEPEDESATLRGTLHEC